MCVLARALHACRMTAVKATAAVAPEQRCWCGVDTPQPPAGALISAYLLIYTRMSSRGSREAGREPACAQARPHLNDGLIGEQVRKEMTCSQLHHGRLDARADRQTD